MLKKIYPALIIFLFLSSPSFAQIEYKCPYCKVHIEYKARICWHCKSDLTEYWREYHRQINRDIISYAVVNYGIAGDIIKKEKAKKVKLNNAYLANANSVIYDIVNTYEIKFTNIEETLRHYYDSYDISVLDDVRGTFNSTISDFVYSVQNCSGIIDDCDSDAFNRLNGLVDMTNSIRREIESAKAYAPDELQWGDLLVKKNGSSYQLVLPESYSSSSLLVPATLKFNYTEISISGLADNTNLSRYSNLETIEYQGNLSAFDAALHNNCPSLKSVVFSGALSAPPLMTNGKALREDINVYVPQDDIRVFGSQEGWSVSNLISTGDSHDLYAKNGVLYDYDKRYSQVSIQQYLKKDSSTPIILSEINGVPITNIGSNAFAKSSFKTIDIPPTVRKIGDGAFSNCVKLETIEIPETVTEIGNNAFADCAALEKIIIPENVKIIGEKAFRGCLRLKDVIIEGANPPSASSNFVPAGCWITVGEGLLDIFIDSSTYRRCRKVREAGIGQYRAYDGSQIYLVSESDKSAKLIKGMDTETLVLTYMVLDYKFKLTGIGPRAFDGCSKLTSLTIPSSLTSIDAEGFFGASNLTAVYSLGDVPPACDKAIFEKKNSCYVYVPSNAVKAYKKQKGWRSSHKIVGTDSFMTSEESKSFSGGVIEQTKVNATGKASKATSSGMSVSKVLTKWANVISNPKTHIIKQNFFLIGSQIIVTGPNFQEYIIEDPDIVGVDSINEQADGCTQLIFKTLRTGSTHLYVIFSDREDPFCTAYHITVN